MESIPLPKKIQITHDKDNPSNGEFILSPLYPGYGPTIANSLRRILLSSLPGAAIYAFKIKGVTHEFSSIDYIKEDVVDITLNLKRVNIKSYSNEPVALVLKAEGEKVVTARDIEKNSDIEISNPDQVIMTLTDKAASVNMTLWVRTGRGYETVELRTDEDLEVNAIAIDTIYTPIRQVRYDVENVRVGGRTDYDEIKMRVETNGTISVEEAIKQSASILADHFNQIRELNTKDESEEPRVSDEAIEEEKDLEEAVVAKTKEKKKKASDDVDLK